MYGTSGALRSTMSTYMRPPAINACACIAEYASSELKIGRNRLANRPMTIVAASAPARRHVVCLPSVGELTFAAYYRCTREAVGSLMMAPPMRGAAAVAALTLFFHLQL